MAAYSVGHARPVDLPEAPVVLYAGTLHGDRLDVALCARVADALEGRGHLVLLGPDALETAERARLEDAGVVLLGARPSAEVPAYLMHADVLVVPHVVTPFTDSLDPIKLYEYQAAGRPVVSTPVAGFRDAADELVTIADADTFAAVVGGMVDGVGARVGGLVRRADAERLALIDWSTRVDRMAAILTRLRAGGST